MSSGKRQRTKWSQSCLKINPVPLTRAGREQAPVPECGKCAPPTPPPSTRPPTHTQEHWLRLVNSREDSLQLNTCLNADQRGWPMTEHREQLLWPQCKPFPHWLSDHEYNPSGRSLEPSLFLSCLHLSLFHLFKRFLFYFHLCVCVRARMYTCFIACSF